MSTGNRRSILGYAWFVYPGAADGTTAGGPFGAGQPGNVPYWAQVSASDHGIRLARPGAAFLVVTVGPTPPATDEGWEILPADFAEDFEARGGEVRLKRVVGTSGAVAPGTPLEKAMVLNCEFEVPGELDEMP